MPPWCGVIVIVVASNWMTWKEWSKGRVSGKEYALVSLALTPTLTLVLSMCLAQLLPHDQIWLTVHPLLHLLILLENILAVEIHGRK